MFDSYREADGTAFFKQGVDIKVLLLAFLNDALVQSAILKFSTFEYRITLET